MIAELVIISDQLINTKHHCLGKCLPCKKIKNNILVHSYKFLTTILNLRQSFFKYWHFLDELYSKAVRGRQGVEGAL